MQVIKILPSFNINSNYHNNLVKHEKPEQIQNSTMLSCLSYFPLNFRGMKDNYLTEQLMSLRGIHCPMCNTVMLNKENFEELVEEGKNNIKTPADFINFLKKHEENINPTFKPAIKYSEDFLQKVPGLKLEHLLNVLSAGSIKRYLGVLKRTNSDINEYMKSQKLSEHDKEICYKYKSELFKLVERGDTNYKSYKYMLAETLYNLEAKDKWEIYQKLKNKIRDANSYCFVFTNSNVAKGNNMSRLEIVLRNLFGQSEGMINQVSKNLKEGNTANYNKILECRQCKENCINLPTEILQDQSIINNFDNYIEDISNAALEGKFYNNLNYPIEVNRLVKNLAKQGKFREEGALFKLKCKMFVDEVKNFDFELVNVEDIPCACCGQKTITHKQRLALEDEIFKTKDMHELNDFVNSHMEYVRTIYKPFVEEFQRLLQQNPKISQEDMLKALKSYFNKSIKVTLEAYNNKLSSPKLLGKYHKQTRNCFKEYIKQSERFIKLNSKNAFPMNDYVALLSQTIGKMEGLGKDDLFYKMRANINKKYRAQRLLYKDMSSYPADDKMKVIFMNIFSGSVATKDHLEASILGGSDNKKNLVVMCKECNKEKGGDSFSYFIKHHRMMKHNLVKNLNTVQALSDEGKIKGYETYKYDVLNHVNKDLLKNDIIKS